MDARGRRSARRRVETAASTRLLPSGDTYYLLHGRERDLLVVEERFRSRLWTPRVWPGAVLQSGEIVGTWRRSGRVVTIDAWTSLRATDRGAVEAEASALPLPGVSGPVEVAWER